MHMQKESEMSKEEVMIIKRAKKARQFIKRFGKKAFFELVIDRTLKKRKYKEVIEYSEWLENRKLNEKVLRKQKQREFQIEPMYLLILEANLEHEELMKESIVALSKQTYPHYKLLILAKENIDLVKTKFSQKNIEIIADVDEIIVEENRTTYFMRLQCGDYLCQDALFQWTERLQVTDPHVLYFDSDHINYPAKTFDRPAFKSKLNLTLLEVQNYISRSYIAKVTSVEELSECFSMSHHEFLLTCARKGMKISHMSFMLNHECDECDYYDIEEETQILKRYFEAKNEEVIISKGLTDTSLKITYKRESYPPISVVIPNKDHVEDLEKCIKSLAKQCNFESLEIIIVENNSTEEETFLLYKQLEERYANIKVVYWEREFNYSLICNYGVQFATNEYLLMLNNDIELIDEDGMLELLNYAMKSDVGIVGSKLFFPDDTIQHAGVIIGLGGLAGHAFLDEPRDENGRMDLASLPREVSAVTAAYFLTKRSVFDEVEGFYDGLAVAFNDVDFCLKVRDKGYSIIYQPHAIAYHCESKSRGNDDTPEKKKRFRGEVRTLKSRWRDFYAKGDPFYNRNLTIAQHDYAMRSAAPITIEDLLEL